MSLQHWAQDLFHVSLDDDMLQKFAQYQALLIEWNTRINLTSITDPQEITIKHFLDSLSLLKIADLPDEARVLDMGTGGGLPGIALQIVRPAWQVTLMDATAKKVRFLETVIQELGLTNAQALQFRAEDAGQAPAYRERYDVVAARALARMPILAEYLLPLCKVGGLCVAMKGSSAPIEAVDASYAIKLLGGQILGIDKVLLPTLEEAHFLVKVAKITPTPSHYPRRAGVPIRKPLVKP